MVMYLPKVGGSSWSPPPVWSNGVEILDAARKTFDSQVGLSLDNVKVDDDYDKADVGKYCNSKMGMWFLQSLLWALWFLYCLWFHFCLWFL